MSVLLPHQNTIPCTPLGNKVIIIHNNNKNNNNLYLSKVEKTDKWYKTDCTLLFTVALGVQGYYSSVTKIQYSYKLRAVSEIKLSGGGPQALFCPGGVFCCQCVRWVREVMITCPGGQGIFDP